MNFRRAGVLKNRSRTSIVVPRGRRHVRHGRRRAALDVDARAVAVLGGRGLEPEPRDGGDGRERLAPEPHRRDGGEPLRVAELRGRVALEREQGVVAVHPAAVVGHAHQREPALLDVDGDRAGARVEGVLDELLHDGGGSLDHLARGDLVHEPGGQDVDARHRAPS